MKRYIAASLAALCLLSTAGCKQEQKPAVTTAPTTAAEDSHHDHVHAPESTFTFAAFLDGENLVPGLSQQDFITQVEQYSFEGKQYAGMHYDGIYGGGWSASGLEYGFRNDYTTTEEREHATYSNKIYATVPLEGLDMPYGITFRDSLSTVLKMLGIDLDPKTGFVADDEGGAVMTLTEDGKGVVTLTDCSLLDEDGLYAYELCYTEIYPITRGDGRAASVTRYVRLSFSDSTLKRIEAQVAETYKLT